jgi:NADH-quinone oxidoreductase subunit L
MPVFILMPLFPLLGVILNGLVGIRFFSKRAAGLVAAGAAALSFFAAAASFLEFALSGGPALTKSLYTWIPGGLVRLSGGGAALPSVELAFRYDSLAGVMALVVTGVGLLIHIYSIGYMAEDPGYVRYFAYLNLFTFAMLVLVLAANLAVMFVGWEGVGLCSYLLIGFWYDRDSAADAGKKAFIMNRVGDFGFILAMGLLLSALGTLDTAGISDAVQSGGLGRAAATAAALLLFLGACGKSAQIPLYTWLPDAMEGPTPVSALIHAATMVTAGVYLVARMHALFSFSGTALTIVALVGAVTAVYAASLALVQHDIKRVLAYSTISQLGLMFVGLGVGAFAAGIFHLLTHAFFKGLLFLAAGSVIHALSGEQDMRKMGGLRSHLPRTYLVFLAGALAIAGIPGLSGFFSKDEILVSAFASGRYAVWALGTLGAAMTSFYMFRLIFLTFFGPERLSPQSRRHLHESPGIMMVPLQILAVLAVIGGYVGLPHVLGGGAWFSKFLEGSTGAHEVRLAAATEILLMAVSAVVAFAGLAAAYSIYVIKDGGPARRLAERFGRTYRVLLNKYYVDSFYGQAVAGGALLAGRVLSWFDDRVIDGLVNGSAALVRRVSAASEAFDSGIVDGAVNGVGFVHRSLSSGLRRLQSGYVYNYALSIVLGIVVLISIFATVF